MEQESLSEAKVPNAKKLSKRSIKCIKCDFQTNKKRYLVKHEQSQHVERLVKYSCNQCKYQGYKEKLFLSHKKTMHGNEYYSCNQCRFGARTKSNLNIHTRTKHEGLFISCKLCPYFAGTKGILAAHVSNIHDGVRYPCDKCDLKASSKHTLMKHKFSKHLGNNQATNTKPSKMNLSPCQPIHENISYKCDFCGYQFFTEVYLSQHLQYVHSDEMRYS